MIRTGLSIIIVTMTVLMLLLTACTSAEDTASESQIHESSSKIQESSDAGDPARVLRNGENDLVFDMTANELIEGWNAVCDREGTPDACLPPLEQFETYVEDTSIPSDHRTRHYVYAPGDARFYPVLNIYVSEESGQLLQIELNYNEHDLRDNTWRLHEEMCFVAAGVLMPDISAKELASLCREVNELAAEKIVSHEERFGKGMVPGVLICHNGIGVYPYFAVGSRSHFCVIPVDEETISNYQEAGTEIRQQYCRHDN